MKFLIQNDNNVLDVEKQLLIGVLNNNKYTQEYTVKVLNDIDAGQSLERGLIPVGTIEFVTEYLRKTENFKKENPIELPKYLREEHFLKREYNIVTWDNIPRKGRYFLKDASTLKHFSYCGNMEYFIQEEMFEESAKEFDPTLRLSKEALYIVSEPVDILSEYRVYVIGNKIQAISNYDGSPLIFPDASIIEEVVELIKEKEKWLKSYTIDIMVTPKGTSLIEIHNFTSVGLYTTLVGNELIYGYRDGIDYLLNDNKQLEI